MSRDNVHLVHSEEEEMAGLSNGLDFGDNKERVHDCFMAARLTETGGRSIPMTIDVFKSLTPSLESEQVSS